MVSLQDQVAIHLLTVLPMCNTREIPVHGLILKLSVSLPVPLLRFSILLEFL